MPVDMLRLLIVVNGSTWLQKCVVMCILQRILQGVKSDLIVRLYWATLGVTFIGALAVTFVDCRPFRLYWQVVPNPGIKTLMPQKEKD